MNNTEKIKKLCNEAAKGKISPKDFYETLSKTAAASGEESDLACLLEDAMMDLEMDGSAEAVKETAARLMEELNGHF
ncbi:MAG: hypothetical protein K2K57_07590 [Oscillospiraceae bacterium]|nr:hypothetical protein [Oscillospiraceae bacterium]